jgi:hypothetical protein
MIGAVRQNIFHDPPGKFTGPLILLQHNLHVKAGSDVLPILSVHVGCSFPSLNFVKLEDALPFTLLRGRGSVK